MIKLYVMNGAQRGQSYALKGETTTLGRSSDNDIQIKEDHLSRKHLEIIARGNRCFIVDLGSTNGTLLNGEKIEPGKEFEVGEGSPIVVGKTIICLGEALPGGDSYSADLIDLTKEIAMEGEEDMDQEPRPMTHFKNMEFLYKVSMVLMGSLDVNEIFHKIMDHMFDLLKRIDRGAIILIDHKSGKFKQIISRSKYETGKSKLNYSRTVVNRVIEQGKPVMMTDTSQESPEKLSDSMEQVRSVMCVPLISKSEIRGVIYVDSLSAPHGFRREDLYLLTALSTSAAISIENALLYSSKEARFKAIFDHMTSGVVVCEVLGEGEDFVVKDFNRAAQRIEDIEANESLGKRVSEVLAGFNELELLGILNRVWATGNSEQHLVTLNENEERPRWREYRLYQLPSKEIVAIFDDVTEKKEAELRQLALQEQLFASQKMESIGALAGGMAHNFRNILQAISGNVEYIETMYHQKPEVNESAKGVYNSIERGVDLINDLLHFSKRGEEPQIVNLDLADVILKTYDIIHRVFDKKIKIEVNLEKELFVKGNHSLLSQVFMNCFTNARDAMPDGGKLLIEGKKSGDKVVAIVSDTGHGMDKETLSKIFDPFFTLKEVGMGTGLGLSTARGIVEQHDGSIHVSSNLGKGSTVRILFPKVENEGIEEIESKREIINGTGQKVLIVDDERNVLEALTSLTKNLGYQTISVDRPTEAIKNYRKWAPDLVLMDRSMPEMDGVACIKRIMDMDPKSKIIIISGYNDSGQNGIEESVRKNIKGYITKPCDMKELSRALFDALH
jgi:signal transduction histidine kinase/CheY-like chemotaxis protein